MALAVVHVDDGGVTFRQLGFLDSESEANQPMSWAVGGGDNNTVSIENLPNGDIFYYYLLFGRF